MIWGQACLACVVWIGYGFFQRSRQDVIRDRISALSRSKRVLLGSLGFIVGAILLLGGLWLVSLWGGLTPDGLTLGGWFAVALLGLVFVHIQVMAAASMISLVQEAEQSAVKREAEPPKASQSSGKKNQS